MEIANRIQLTQAWWVGAELVRRHPELTLRGDDHMTYLTLVDRVRGQSIASINPTTIHARCGGGSETTTKFTGSSGAICSNNTKEFIERLEKTLGLSTPKRAPSTGRHALAFRLIAAVLAVQINDHHEWDCRNEVADEDFGPFGHQWIDQFPDARSAMRNSEIEGWEGGLRARHFWGITRAGLPLAVVSVKGVLYRPTERFDLMSEYSQAGRRLLPVVAKTLGDVLV